MGVRFICSPKKNWTTPAFTCGMVNENTQWHCMEARNGAQRGDRINPRSVRLLRYATFPAAILCHRLLENHNFSLTGYLIEKQTRLN